MKHVLETIAYMIMSLSMLAMASVILGKLI